MDYDVYLIFKDTDKFSEDKIVDKPKITKILEKTDSYDPMKSRYGRYAFRKFQRKSLPQLDSPKFEKQKSGEDSSSQGTIKISNFVI